MSKALVPACQEVLGPDKLCGQPCEDGRTRCKDHKDPVPARTSHQLVEAARQRVLIKLEENAEDLATELMAIARDHDMAPGPRLDAIKMALNVLGMDKMSVAVETTDVTPGRIARDMKLLQLLERAGAPDRANQVRGALGIAIEASASG